MEKRRIIPDSPSGSNPDRAAVAALLTGAIVWGLIWYPYRALAGLGISGVASATLTYGDKSVDLPVLSGTTGPDVIDIRKLYGATDAFTYDPGFTSTAACESALTFIDGQHWTEVTSEPVDALLWALKRIRTGDVVSCRVGGHQIIPMRLPSLYGAWT